MDYKLRMPITTYHDIKLDEKNIVELLEQELKKLAGRWDTIIQRKDGTGYYYNRGYGSHDIGEKDGPDVPVEVMEAYTTIQKTICYFETKIKTKESVQK